MELEEFKTLGAEQFGSGKVVLESTGVQSAKDNIAAGKLSGGNV
jgi:hypothetical protein